MTDRQDGRRRRSYFTGDEEEVDERRYLLHLQVMIGDERQIIVGEPCRARTRMRFARYSIGSPLPRTCYFFSLNPNRRPSISHKPTTPPPPDSSIPSASLFSPILLQPSLYYFNTICLMRPMLLFPKRTFLPSLIRHKGKHGFLARKVTVEWLLGE